MASQVDLEVVEWMREQFEALAGNLSDGTLTGAYATLAHGALLMLADVGRRLDVLDEAMTFAVLAQLTDGGPCDVQELLGG